MFEDGRWFNDDEHVDEAGPIPQTTEELVPWLRKLYPEVTPRTSNRDVIDACLARAGIIDLIDFIEASLEQLKED